MKRANLLESDMPELPAAFTGNALGNIRGTRAAETSRDEPARSAANPLCYSGWPDQPRHAETPGGYSKSGGRKVVWVRFPPSALKQERHARCSASNKPLCAIQSRALVGGSVQGFSPRRDQCVTTSGTKPARPWDRSC